MAGANFIINVKEKGAKKAEKNVKGLNKALGGLKSQAMLAAGAFLGTGMLVAGIKKAVDAFGEQELAEKKLEQALGRTSQALLNQASALQQVSTFGDEAIITAQSLIASFVDDEEQIKKATAATLDLAAAKGMDLNAAADLVSKTLGSSTNAMSRYGIEVTGAVGSTERLESLTTNIANVFGGQASAQADTMTGSIKQMKNAVGDAAESLASLLAPSIIKAATLFKGAAEAVGFYFDSLRTLDDQEIKNSQNKERLLVEIEKVSKALKEEQIGVTKAGIGLETMGHSANFSKEKVDELQEKLRILETRYQNLNILIADQNSPEKLQEEAEAHKSLTAQIEKRTIINEESSVDYLKNLETIKGKETDFEAAIQRGIKQTQDLKKQQLIEDLKNASLSGQSASDAMKSVVRAEVMEASAGYFSSIFKNVPFPFNIGLAAGAGSLVAGMADQMLNNIPSFATGGDFVTSGEQLIRVGDNQSGRERVQISPLGSGADMGGASSGAVNITFNSPIMSSDYTEDVIIPQIQDAIRRGSSLV